MKSVPINLSMLTTPSDRSSRSLSWTVLGLVIYFLYGYRKSHVGRGITDVPELASEAPGSIGIAPMPGAPGPPPYLGPYAACAPASALRPASGRAP